MRDHETGFTLIELLVVILIIGALAAIALPAFIGHDRKAEDAAAKSDLRNAVTQIESCIASSPSRDATATCAPGAIDGIPDGVEFEAPVDAAANYRIVRVSASGGAFTLEKSGPGGYTRRCDGTSEGCRADLTW